MIKILSAPVAIFLIVGLGFALTRGGDLRRPEVTALSTYVATHALTALIFVNVLGRSFVEILNLTCAISAMAMVTIGAATVGERGVRRHHRPVLRRHRRAFNRTRAARAVTRRNQPRSPRDAQFLHKGRPVEEVNPGRRHQEHDRLHEEEERARSDLERRQRHASEYDPEVGPQSRPQRA